MWQALRWHRRWPRDVFVAEYTVLASIREDDVGKEDLAKQTKTGHLGQEDSLIHSRNF